MELFKVNERTVNGAMNEMYLVIQYSKLQETYIREILKEMFLQGMYKERSAQEQALFEANSKSH